ncbi:MAG: hypothetical protein KatS3mg121_0981 [Gammaproteobacteria bacterium]|nr:MAG: hypothetical protein KatS3mg121_0981 [Gammaproteobacteria bacterium]
MDTIFLEDLRVATVIGIYDWEKTVRQTVSLDLAMRVDLARAAASDRVADTLDYKAVAKRLITYIEGSRFDLIETLAERVAEIVLYEFDVAALRLRLAKPGAVRYSRSVGVVLRRRRGPQRRRTVYVAVGSNVEPERHVRGALADLAREFGALRRSTVYRNPAVGFAGDDFLNLVVAFDSALPEEAILRRLDGIERAHGRVRGTARFAPRSLDLDLLLCGDGAQRADLGLPRADILEHDFVLGPLAELAPDWVHPAAGRPLAALWAERADSAALQPVDWPEDETD